KNWSFFSCRVIARVARPTPRHPCHRRRLGPGPCGAVSQTCRILTAFPLGPVKTCGARKGAADSSCASASGSSIDLEWERTRLWMDALLTSEPCSRSALQHLGQGPADPGRRIRDLDAGRFHGRDLFLSAALTT